MEFTKEQLSELISKHSEKENGLQAVDRGHVNTWLGRVLNSVFKTVFLRPKSEN